MNSGRSLWRKSTVGQELRIRYGKALPKELRDSNAQFPVVGSAGRMTSTNIPLVNGPAIIIGRKGNAGRVWLQESGSWPIDTVYYTEPPTGTFEFRFLAHQLAAMGLEKLDSSTATPSLRREDLEAQELLIPPLSAQAQIVQVIEDHLSRLDASDRMLRDAVARSKSMKRSAALDFQRQAGSGSKLARIGDLANVSSGSTPLRTNPLYFDGGDIPWITSASLANGLIVEASSFVTEQGRSAARLKMHKPGTLLVAMYGEGKTRGTVGELGIDAAINQACAALEVHDPSLVSWVRAILDAQYSQMRNLGGGGVQPNLNLSIIRELQVPLPDATRRDALLSDFDAARFGADRLMLEVERLLARSKRLRASIISAALSGRLNR